MSDTEDYVVDDAAKTRAREALAVVDMIHEGKPVCRLCGQMTNRLDQFGLCSKTSEAHQDWRAGVRRDMRAGAR